MAKGSQYTHAGFALTTLLVMGFFALLTPVVMILAHYQFGMTVQKSDLSSFIPAFFYLSLIMGWAVAYTKFFRFPENQKILILGVIIAALIMPVFRGMYRLLLGQIEIAELFGRLPEMLLGTSLGAAMQLYFMVIALRYIFRRRLPF